MIENYGIINDKAPHVVADLCEIIAFFENAEVSRSDIEGFLQEKGGEGLFKDLDLEALDSAEASEKLQALSEEVFQHLRYRRAAFGDWYPFSVVADILAPHPAPTPEQKMYAALLAFSRLKMFARPLRAQFASDFESICVTAAEGFAGRWSILHFGAGGRDRALFGNKLKDALQALGNRLFEYVILPEINNLSDQNVGDAGIDIVLAREWSDQARSVPAYFAQCAAQQEGWPQKKFEAHYLNLEKFFSFFHKPGNMIFIPICYRSVDGDWVNSDGHQAIIIDRLRLIKLLSEVLADSDDPNAVLAGLPSPFELGCAA